MHTRQLAFSTNAFKQTDVFDAVAAIARIGYAGVEIMADAPHMRADTFSDADAQRLARHIADLGLAVSNVNAFTGFCFTEGDTYHPTWVETDPTLRQQRVDYTRRAIELTAAIGGSHLSVQPGGPYQGLDRNTLTQRFAESLAECLDAARQYDVTIGIEPEPGLLIETAAQHLDFKSAHFADEPLVTMNCDLGHHFCVREDPADVLRDHASHIQHIHIEDIAATRVHQHLVPGDGAMDFQAIFNTLDTIGYDGWLTVELYPYTAEAENVARRAFEYFQRFLSAE